MESAEIGAAARAFAAERELIVWESFPWGGATVVWPAAEDLKGYLDVVQRVGARILYLEDDGAVLGFAANGVDTCIPERRTATAARRRPGGGRLRRRRR